MSAVRRVALVQAVLVPSVAVIGGAISGRSVGFALFYGGLVALAANAILAWREAQAARHPEWDQHRLLKQFIRVGLERLVVLVGLLAVGFGALKLAPLPLLVGLVLAQGAWVAASRR